MNILLCILPFFSLSLATPCNNVIVCYYPTYRSWMLPPRKIDANLCTHVVVAFAKVENNTLVPEFSYDIDTYAGVLVLKNSNPDLKILISVGGENSAHQFSEMIKTDEGIHNFAKSVPTFLDTHRFDGLDIDWEFPEPNQKDKFGTLLKYLREEMGTNRILAAAVTANNVQAGTCYPHAAMQQHLDLVLEMSYNFHGLWEDHTGINAPLIGPAGDPFTTDYIMREWEKLGISKDKLVLGIPAYGTDWRLTTARNDVGAPGTPITWRTYNEICIVNSTWTWKYDAKYDGTYAISGDRWLTMETEAMVAKKSNYVLERGYKGVLFWEIAQDDFNGFCNAGKFPLVTAAKHVLCPSTGGSTISPQSTSTNSGTTSGLSTSTVTAATSTSATGSTSTTTVAPSTGTTGSISTATAGTGAPTKCSEAGSFPDPTDCHYYYVCGNVGVSPIRMACPSTLVFNPTTKNCDWKYNVASCNS